MASDYSRIVQAAGRRGWSTSGFPRTVFRKGTKVITVTFYPEGEVKAATDGTKMLRGRDKAGQVIEAMAR